MAPQLTHQDIQELLGAYAVDAVDPDEAAAIELHLAECPRCRAEVAEHREAAALLAFGGATAPAGMWSRIAATIDGGTPPFELAAPVGPLRAGRTRLRVLGAAAAAAVVVIGALAVQVVRQDHRIDQLAAITDERGLSQAAAAAAVAPGARTVELRSEDGVSVADAIVLPDGHGYLVHAELPALDDDETYQLWGILDGQTISLGLLGVEPTISSFNAAGPLVALAITAEQVGGAVAPTQVPIVQGDLAAD